MSAIEITACPLSLNKIIMDTLGGAMRKVLKECAEKINSNFDALTSIDPEDRLETIIRMFGLEDEDTVKIIQPAKKKASDPKMPKAKAEKKIPVPFWIYRDATTKAEVNTSKPNLCQGLTAGLYSQCPAKPKDGNVYCTKCLKDAMANDGTPKRGNIAMRIEQFEHYKYEYTPPNSKTVKKIYPLEWALKNKYTEEEFDEMLRENEVKLTEQGKKLIKFIPERKTRAKKTKNLTEDMLGKKKAKKASEPEEEPEEDEDDDNVSVSSDYTTATEDADVPYPDEDEEEETEEPEPEPKKTEPKKTETKPVKSALKAEVKYTTNIANYRSFKIGDERYASLKDEFDPEGDFDIYGVRNFVSSKEYEVTVKPVGTFNPKTGEKNIG